MTGMEIIQQFASLFIDLDDFRYPTLRRRPTRSPVCAIGDGDSLERPATGSRSCHVPRQSLG